MNQIPDDPKLTAYALGELDAAERAEIEARLAESDGARKFVDEVRSVATLLEAELAGEPSPGLADAQKQTIERRLQRPAARRHPKVYWMSGALAAGLLVTVGVLYQYRVAPNPLAMSAARSALPAKSQFARADLQETFFGDDDGKRDQSDRYGERQNKRESNFAFNEQVAGPVPATATPSSQPVASDPTKSFSPLPESRRMSGRGGRGRGQSGEQDSASAIAADKSAPAPAAAARFEVRAEADGAKANVVDAKQSLKREVSQSTRLRSRQLGQQVQGQGGQQGQGQSQGRSKRLAGVRDVERQKTPQAGRQLAASSVRARRGENGKRRLSTLATGLEREVADQIDGLTERTRQEGELQLRELTLGRAQQNTEAYNPIVENPFVAPKGEAALSTFSIDVDTAAYANVRRFLTQNTMPPKDAVRLEEMINYFSYDYAQPEGDDPFSVNLEVAECPWQPKHRLLRIGLKGREIPKDERPQSNLVFLVDVSGSMKPQNKLPLLKKGMRMLVQNLSENDRVAIVVYASATGLVLPSTTGAARESILHALDKLQAGGSTNGGAGIQLAYDVAVANYIKGGVNRVILATDGDFNVGVTSDGALVRLIETKAKTGVFLSVLGFGQGNLKDAKMEQLADKGNGNYFYIDSEKEARKVLVEEMGGTLVTIAKDVKLQIEFNPAKVAGYRLVGYENRVMRNQDFRDDTKDAGEIGAGHTVTALYEIVPTGKASEVLVAAEGKLKYQTSRGLSEAATSGDLVTVFLRYKQPDGEKATEFERVARDAGQRYAEASDDYKFAAAVASFGMLLRDSKYKGNASYASVLELANEGLGVGKSPYRKEFLELVRKERRHDSNGA